MKLKRKLEAASGVMHALPRRTLKNRLRALLSAKIVAVVLLLSVTIVAATIFYYYTIKVQVSVEAPKIQWVTGDDIAATIGTNDTWCEISLSKLQPNATTVYTSALKSTVLAASAASGMKLQVASLTDTSAIIWGIRFYIFTSGAGSTDLTLVDGGVVTVSGTDGGAAVAEVGYRQSGAPAGYGSTTTPTESGGFTGAAATTYIIVIEAYGEDGILTTDTADIELKLVWS